MKSFNRLFLAAVLAFSFMAGLSTAAAETVGEKASEVGHDMKKETKKAYRKVKDKTCEMVNGKMECAAKKVKHKVQNGMDEVSDKVEDVTK